MEQARSLTLVTGVEVDSTLENAGIDRTDPLAVLALHLAAAAATGIQSRVSRSKQLLDALPPALPEAGHRGALETPQAVVRRIADLQAVLNAEFDPLGKESERAEKQAREAVDARQEEVASLESQKAKHSAFLWWLGIGFLRWKFSGHSERLSAANAQAQAGAEALTRAVAFSAMVRPKLNQIHAEMNGLLPVAEILSEPIPLPTMFGWSHVPLEVRPGVRGDDRLIFSSLLGTGLTLQLTDMPGGPGRASALEEEIATRVPEQAPILLSAETSDDPRYQGLVGEELRLAQAIDQLSAVLGDAVPRNVTVGLVPGDASLDQQLPRWKTTRSTEGPFFKDNSASDVDSAAAAVASARLERDDPASSPFAQLRSISDQLKARQIGYHKQRHDALEGVLANDLREWLSWSDLSTTRRYCPSYHRAPGFLYDKLGFDLRQDDTALFDADGSFKYQDQLKWLPDPEPIRLTVRHYSLRHSAHAPAGELERMRQDIRRMIRSQVEDNQVVPLSKAATLKYSPQARRWTCGLCTHTKIHSGELGCPSGGHFSDEQARLAELLVPVEDVFVPMRSALFKEKSTQDELNRIFREKEGQLRERLTEEQDALRSEVETLKHDVSARRVKLQDVRGEAVDVLHRFAAEAESGSELGAIDAARKRQLLDDVEAKRRQIEDIGALTTQVQNAEDILTRLFEMTERRRTVRLDTPIRRATDSPDFLPAAERPGAPPAAYAVSQRTFPDTGSRPMKELE